MSDNNGNEFQHGFRDGKEAALAGESCEAWRSAGTHPPLWHTGWEQGWKSWRPKYIANLEAERDRLREALQSLVDCFHMTDGSMRAGMSAQLLHSKYRAALGENVPPERE